MANAKRSRSDQVVPDGLLQKRVAASVTVISAPGTKEAKRLPLVGGKEMPSAFSEMGTFSVAGRDEGAMVPALRWSRPCWPKRSESGKVSTILFTATSKMNCPSFSLPAGPPLEGGTCIAASRSATGKGLREPGRIYTCDRCYAFGANYAYDETVFSQLARAWWVQQELEADLTGARLAASFIRMISEFARRVTYGKEGLVRLMSELGVWNGDRIWVPIDEEPGKKKSRLMMQPAFVTRLPPEMGAADSGQWLRTRMQPVDGEITGFFRLHDSGDFNIGSKPSLWIPYIQAWGLVAKALPKVLFWAPTRAWILPNLKKAMIEASAAAPNLVIRPSALHVSDPAPRIQGLAMGTTVIPRPQKDEKKKTVALEIPAGERPCPVYLPSWDPSAEPTTKKRILKGETGNWLAKTSCMTAGCRRCWVDGSHGQAYGLH